jgi:hypothetical protein
MTTSTGTPMEREEELTLQIVAARLHMAPLTLVRFLRGIEFKVIEGRRKMAYRGRGTCESHRRNA